MRLIIQKLDGSVYVYRETEKMFKNNEKQRANPLLDSAVLDDECDLGKYEDFHMVIPIKKAKGKKK